MADGTVSTLTNPITGTGTTNFLPKFTGASTLGNSAIQDNTSSIVYTFSSNPVLNITDGTRSSFFGTATTAGAYVNASQVGDAFIRANNGIVFSGANGTGGELRLDASGNLGLGVTPSAWNLGKALQIGTTTSFFNDASGNSYLGNNFYYNSAFLYSTTANAVSYVLTSTGEHRWNISPSGTAGNAISFTQAMTLNASGNLSLGNTNDTYKLDVTGTGRFTGTLTAATLTDGFITIGAAQINRTSATVEMQFAGSGDVRFFGNTAYPISFIAGTGAATFSSSVTANGLKAYNAA
jgi:hypothetical protein